MLEQLTPPPGQSCVTCKFVMQRGVSPNFYYECHVNPPIGIQSLWPHVRQDDWCGVWQSQPERRIKMSAVPVVLNGVMMPKGKSADDKPVPAVFLGYLSIQGLEVGGGPIIPPDSPPELPVDPPPTDPGPNVVVVVKPAPATGGWGIATDSSGSFKWYYTPSAMSPGPKR